MSFYYVIGVLLVGEMLYQLWRVVNRSVGQKPVLLPIDRAVDSGKLCAIEIESQEVLRSGFLKLDEFFLSASRIPTFIFVRRADFIVLTLCEIRGRCRFILGADFTNGYVLETTSISFAGSMPRPKGKLLQVFPDVSLSELLQKHLEGDQFLYSRGFKKCENVPTADQFRARLGEDQENLKKRVHENFFSFIPILFHIYFGNKKFQRPLSAQRFER